MRILRTVLPGLLSLALVLGLEGGSVAFHSGGVGECDGCHSMHNSSEGMPNVFQLEVGGTPPPGLRPFGTGTGPYLLRASDPSGSCLNCHERVGDIGPTTFHVSTPYTEVQSGTFPYPKQLTPGGDFGWLFKNYSWSSGSSLGDRHGHNIVAIDFSYLQDDVNTLAPGGTYPSGRLGCTSCHDPHGRYRRNNDGSITTTGRPIAGSGSFKSSPGPDATFSVGAYRMLAGRGYLPVSMSTSGAMAFSYDPPAAVAPDKPNRSEAVTQTRVAYGTGMSEWCRNCHPNIHMYAYPGTSSLIHATGQLVQPYIDNYNKYVKTGVIATSPTATPYLSLVPFEEGTSDYTVLKSHANTDDSWLAGPDRTNAQVMCLSCHRAHASGWDSIMRWNTKSDFIVYNGSYAPSANPGYAQNRSEAEARQAYYDRPASKFAFNQDSLCNKCHIGVYP